MFNIGMMEMLIIGILLVGGLVAIIAMTKGIGGFRLGHAMLDCPYCGKATRATEGKCRHCGQSFT
ncbi:MAG: hypothetical protein EXS05_03660 [Planctomycetaceae bacterium]|nr:hypothetical protein [Planctomycetaceae bacterium]